MIVLKHLSREYDIDPYQLRVILRKNFGLKRSWRWENEKDPELKKIRKLLAGLKSSDTNLKK